MTCLVCLKKMIRAPRAKTCSNACREKLHRYGPTKKAHVSHATGHKEWYTPERFTDAAREVMGEIDLDPASSAAANEIVKAVRFYTEGDDGLSQPWAGRVWMNPPYAQPFITQFCQRVAAFYRSGEVSEAVVLVNNASETRFFQALDSEADAVCFPKGRIKFWYPDKPSFTPLQGQAIFYLGPHSDRYREVFGQFGRCR